MDINTIKQVALTYARAAGAAVIAMYMAGETEPKKLAYAFITVLRHKEPPLPEKSGCGGFLFFLDRFPIKSRNLPSCAVKSRPVELHRWRRPYAFHANSATQGRNRVAHLSG